MTIGSPSSLAALAERCRERFFSIAEDFDIVVTTDPIHIGYLAGYRTILHDMPGYRQALIATRDRIALVTGASDGAAALEVLGDPEAIWRYGLFYVERYGDTAGYPDMPAAHDDFRAALKAALESFATAGKTVGLDIPDAADRGFVHETLPASKLGETALAFRRSRMVKLDGELDLLRKASRITDEALAAIHPLIRRGVDELEISAEISRHIVRNGGIPRFVVVTSGERSSRVDAYAMDRKLANGDLVRLDVGCTVGGYYSDMARTLITGEPSEEQAARYQSLLEGESAQLDLLRPGVKASEVYDVAMRKVRQGALPGYNRNHCGHAIGLKAHEYPAIAPGQDVVLEPGMIFCVETPYYELGWGGMMVEDTAIITAKGHELLTVSSRQLRPVV
jgi:Xaa-Pro aminopeptidase